MSKRFRSQLTHLPEGALDPKGELFLPPENEPGSSPGGGLGDGTTSGTTGRVLPPGADNPVDDEI